MNGGENKLKNENGCVNFYNSIFKNLTSWLIVFVAICVISYPDIVKGLTTFFIALLIAYFVHKDSHEYYNICTVVHRYHHEHNNFFSHFSQILLEFTLLGIFIPFFYFIPNFYLNPWILGFFILFYSSIHNINYSILHVNNVHSLHHKYVKTNLGPDVCDVIFGTKNTSETEVENTNHYIPNVVCATFIILLLKYFWKNENNRSKMLCILNTFMISSFAFLVLSSIYLHP